MDDRSIAWMLSGGLRAEAPERRRQREHRFSLALLTAGPSRTERWLAAIRRLAPAVVAPTLTADCCAA
jgi:hypothetical protein